MSVSSLCPLIVSPGARVTMQKIDQDHCYWAIPTSLISVWNTGRAISTSSFVDGDPMLRHIVHRVHDQPEVIRIAIVAAIGTVLAWVTYEIVYLLNPFTPRATVSWVIAFTIGIFRQHHLHRTLSFPNTRLSYHVSLKREVVASIFIIFASAALNYVLTHISMLHHRLAWGICLCSTASLEYALMKLFVFHSRRKGGRP